MEPLLQAWWAAHPRMAPPRSLSKAIDHTYEEPITFWRALFHLQGKGVEPSRSQFAQGYNFYHDCVVRHLGKRWVALREIARAEVKEWTFDQLHRFVNSEVGKWKEILKPGERIALVMPIGLHYLTALLTALRLGLVVTSLPSDTPLLSPSHINKWLLKLAPKRVILSPASPTIDKGHPRILIDDLEEGRDLLRQESYTYQPDELFQESLATMTQKEEALVPLTAERGYLCASRDGIFSFGLKPGIVWASPLSCSLKEQPCKLLSAMLGGATTLHLSHDELHHHPQLLKKETIHLLGISPSLKRFLSESGNGRPTPKFWYKNPFDDEIHSWEAFLEECKFDKLPTSSLLIDNSLGGVALLSPPSIGRPVNELFPSPGSKWQLLPPGPVASPHYGIFDSHSLLEEVKEGEAVAGNLQLARFGEGWLPVGSLLPHREGGTLPLSLIEESLKALPFVEECVALSSPRYSSPINQEIVLLIFVDPKHSDTIDQQSPSWKEAIRGEIATELGPFYLPDEIAISPLLPRKEGESIDRAWCHSQYYSGLLEKKRSLPIYRALQSIKEALLHLKTQVV